jgi:23S rRNA (adenine1618-N6)-methyltransferase
VASRFNYILWLQDLLDTTGDDYRDKYDPEREVVGLDM